MREPTFEQVRQASGMDLNQDAWNKMTPEMRQQFGAALGVTSVPIGTKRGRPANPVLDIIRNAHPACSRRTHARIKRAMDLLYRGGIDSETIARLETLYTRPNGSFNAAGFEGHAEVLLILRRDDT